MIELRRLRAFVTVVEEGNITRAAERLFIQQPPLTRLLAESMPEDPRLRQSGY